MDEFHVMCTLVGAIGFGIGVATAPVAGSGTSPHIVLRTIPALLSFVELATLRMMSPLFGSWYSPCARIFTTRIESVHAACPVSLAAPWSGTWMSGRFVVRIESSAPVESGRMYVKNDTPAGMMIPFATTRAGFAFTRRKSTYWSPRPDVESSDTQYWIVS